MAKKQSGSQTREEDFQVIEENGRPKCPVRPSRIKLGCNGQAGRFGKAEVEMAAGKLISFFQLKDRWSKFSITELFNFYKLKGWDPNKMFFGLCGIWYDDGMLAGLSGTSWKGTYPYLVLDTDGFYRVTNIFIERCLEE